jgi:hypothetical protein
MNKWNDPNAIEHATISVHTMRAFRVVNKTLALSGAMTQTSLSKLMAISMYIDVMASRDSAKYSSLQKTEPNGNGCSRI